MQGKRVAVIGAGIVGVTSAYELAAQGCQVTVFERRGSVAEETSFANSGLVAPHFISPWAAPGMPGKLLAALFQRHPSHRLSWPFGLNEVSWLNKWSQHCKAQDLEMRQQALQELATLSQDRLKALIAEHSMDLEVRTGLLVLARTSKDWQALQAKAQALKAQEIKHELLSSQEARQLELALNPDTELAGALHLPDEISVNCRQFANLLRTAGQRYNIEWRFDTTVNALVPGRQVQVHSEQGAMASSVENFDQVVICGGVASSQLLSPIGLRLPLLAVHGYSISAPIREPLNAPFGTLLDERHQVTISRLENRIRVSGIHELGGTVNKLSEKRLNTLYKLLNDWFPGAALTSGPVQQWKGARHTLPDGMPLIGNSGLDGIWLNLGHGANGWGMACGSAILLNELMDSKTEACIKDYFTIKKAL